MTHAHESAQPTHEKLSISLIFLNSNKICAFLAKSNFGQLLTGGPTQPIIE